MRLRRRSGRSSGKEKEAADLKSNVSSAITHGNRLVNGMKQLTSIMQPVPEFNPKIEKPANEEPDKDGNVISRKREGMYTKKQFADLEVYGKDQIDLSKIQVGESGKTVTNEEFAAVAFFGNWDPKNAMVQYNADCPDIWAEKSLQGLGYQKDQAGILLTARNRNWWTADLFQVPPRDNEGIFFKTIVNLGRKDALEAFQAYQTGDKEKLAVMLANSVNMAAKDMAVVDNPKYMSEQQKGIVAMTGKIVGLIDKDPVLRDLAISRGMDPENLKAARGMAELGRLQEERQKAEYKMAQAINTGNDLSENDKLQCAKSILKVRMVNQMLYADNKKNSGVVDNIVDNKIGTSIAFTNQGDLEAWEKDPSSRPDPGEGKIYSDTLQAVVPSIAKLETPVSESLKGLSDPKYREDLDLVADQIMKQNDYSKKSTKELFRSLNEYNFESKVDIAGNVQKAAKELAKQKQEVKTEAAKKLGTVNEQKESVKDRAKMFEQKI